MKQSFAVALIATVTLAASARATYTDVRCACNKKIMAIPGVVTRLEVRPISSNALGSGRGPIIKCGNCGLVEVIAHG